MRVWRIGLLGIGAIGRDVVSLIGDRRPDTEFIVLRRSGGDLGIPGARQVHDIDQMVRARPDVVIEAAGHQALETCVPALLAHGVSVIAASVGSLIQAGESGVMCETLKTIAAGTGARLVLPAGAIGGLDYISAVALLTDLRVTYTSRKPPEAWADELMRRGLDASQLDSEVILFEGSVAEAAALYPRNLNVAATIALAVGRPDVVSVRVVIDPAARGNIHEIVCESAAGLARFIFLNTPSPKNPKTSMVTALSLIHCVEEFFSLSPIDKSEHQ